MDPAVQAFKDRWAEKSAAKQESLVATGAAKLAEHNADQALNDTDRARYLAEADQHWAVVAERGISGAEGKLQAEAFAMAEAYVNAHPEQFASFERYVNPDDHDLLVTIITALSKNGREEEALKLTMFELARFERQHFGQRLQAVAKVRR